MITARRVGRWALYALAGVVVLLVVARIGIGVYLNTAAGKAMVARKISAQIGMPVEVTQVRLGLFSSAIGLRVFDPDAPDPAKAEVLAVKSADADITLFGAATGDISPEEVDLHDVKLTLHVGANGDLLTTMPKTPSGAGGGAIPTVKLTNGRVVIHQDGRPEFELQNLNLSVQPNGDRLKLSGTMSDPEWSKWTLSGDVTKSGKSGSVEVTADDVPFTVNRLQTIPFIPADVWKHVKPNGRGAISARVWTDSAGQIQYTASVTPHSAALTVPDANVTLNNVVGTATITGSKVTLSGARAELAGGVVTADADCDLDADPIVAHLKVTADKLDIQKVPPQWDLPRDFEGQLKGHADLTLRIYPNGRIEPEGGGEGVITNVKFRGLVADDIPIHLRKAGNQYEFHQPKKETGHHRHTNTPIACAAAAQPKKPADPAKKAPPPKKDAPTTLDATLRFRDVDIAQLMDKLNFKINYKISGKVTAEATIAVPLSGVTSEAAYQFHGKISSPALTLEGLTIREFAANMTYQDGKFTLSNLSGKIDQPGKGTQAPGTFKGTLTAVRSPMGNVTADLTIDRIPLGQVLQALPDFQTEVRGTIGGKVSLKAPYAKIEDPTQWSGTGEITSTELVVAGRSIKDLRLSATVEKGVAALREASLSLEGIPVRAEASVGLTGKYPFSATVRTTATNVTDLRKLVPEVDIPAPIEGILDTQTTVKGTASPLDYTATGTIKATKLTLAKSSANHIEAKWELTPEKFVVSELKADVFSGTIDGSADVPLVPGKSGKFAVTFKTLDAAVAAALVPDFPVKISGLVSGKISGEIPPAKPGQSRVGNLNVDITAPKLTVQGIPADRLVGKASIRNGALEYSLEGKTLGGSFELEGRYPGQKKDAVPNAGGPGRGAFRLRGVDLSRIGPTVGFQSLNPLRGQLDATFEFDNDFSAGSGQIRVLALQWGSTPLAQQITGTLTLSDGMLRLTDLTGRIAGGELRARAQMSLKDTSRNFATVTLSAADAKQLLAPVTESAKMIDGRLTFVAHVRFGRETRGSGTLTLPHGTISGVQVSGLHIPFQFASAPGGYGEFSIHEAAVSAGTGRAQANLTLNWGFATRVDGKIRFTNVPLRTISPELGENALLGNGRLTGQFNLGGSNVRSVNDLTGTLVASLNNTSVKEIPILRQITPFLNPTGLVKPFQTGDIRATLGNGLFRIQRIALANPAAQVFAEGTVNMTGRVDMNVVAHTGTLGPESRLMRIAGLRIPAVGPLPLTLIRNVSDFFSNRTIRLTINGTTSNPIVRVNVGALLSEEAVRFLLSRYLPTGAAGALGVSGGFGSNK